MILCPCQFVNFSRFNVKKKQNKINRSNKLLEVEFSNRYPHFSRISNRLKENTCLLKITSPTLIVLYPNRAWLRGSK